MRNKINPAIDSATVNLTQEYPVLDGRNIHELLPSYHHFTKTAFVSVIGYYFSKVFITPAGQSFAAA